MAGSQEIRTQIKSIQNTQKITKAMEMVAASKMRKAVNQMEMARPYADKISETELQTLKELLVYDDQTLFDFIFKDIKLGNSDHEDFIKKYLKKYEK